MDERRRAVFLRSGSVPGSILCMGMMLACTGDNEDTTDVYLDASVTEAGLEPPLVPRLEPLDCTTLLPAAVPPDVANCGRLTVLEDRKQPDGRTISFPFVVLKALGPTQASDPHLVLFGGPGQYGVDGAVKN